MLDFLPEDIKNVISFDRLTLCELRLRLGSRVVAVFLGGTSRVLSHVVSEDDLEKTLLKLTKHSFYAYSESLRRGYITSDEGERVGVCGRCVTEGGEVKTIRDVTSLCIRIPRQVVGFSDPLIENFKEKGLSSSLVIAPPGYGKTTFLRDAARNLSLKSQKTVLVSDEKCEIYVKNYAYGNFCDFLLCADKSFAFREGVRNLRPEVIVSDELSSVNDCFLAAEAALSGVTVVASAHASSLAEVKARKVFEPIFACGAFKTAAVIEKNYVVKIFDI